MINTQKHLINPIFSLKIKTICVLTSINSKTKIYCHLTSLPLNSHFTWEAPL